MKAKTFIAFLAFSFGHSTYILAQHNNIDEQVLIMLKNFYTAYMSEFSIVKTNTMQTFETRLDSIKKQYCTTNLIDSINKKFKKNELDYDPLINAQDSDS